MEQNKDIFPDKNSFPDNPYNQYYQEYLKDPEKEKNKVKKKKNDDYYNISLNSSNKKTGFQLINRLYLLNIVFKFLYRKK